MNDLADVIVNVPLFGSQEGRRPLRRETKLEVDALGVVTISRG